MDVEITEFKDVDVKEGDDGIVEDEESAFLHSVPHGETQTDVVASSNSSFSEGQFNGQHFTIKDLSTLVYLWIGVLSVVTIIQSFQIYILSSHNTHISSEYAQLKQHVNAMQAVLLGCEKSWVDQKDNAIQHEAALNAVQTKQFDIISQLVDEGNFVKEMAASYQNMTEKYEHLVSKVSRYNAVVSVFNVVNEQSHLSLEIKADAITLTKDRDIRIREMQSNGALIWSPSVASIFVGDTVTWYYSGLENIVSCDHVTGAVIEHGYLNSGAIGSDVNGQGKYVVTFNEPGEFHYTSEHSASLNGVVIVRELPALFMARYFNNSLPTDFNDNYADDDDDDDGNEAGASVDDDDDFGVPTAGRDVIPPGVLSEVHLQDMASIQGCWVKCYDSGFDVHTPRTFLDSCSGDWVFMGSTTDLGRFSSPHDAKHDVKFLLGAFGRKKKVFTTDEVLSVAKVDRDLTRYATENGAYWFSVGSSVQKYVLMLLRVGVGLCPSR